MRHIFKSVLISIAAIYIAYSLIPTVNFGTDPKNILLFIGGFWLISQVVNPVFSIILLPVNLLTFGLVSFILNIAFIFALLNFLPGFSLQAYNFPGAEIDGIILPAYNFTQIYTIVLFALIATIAQKILHLIFE